MVDSKTIDAWRKAPRLNSFATFFEQTARGLGGAPDLGRPEPEMDLLSFDLDCMTFWDTHRRLWGHFDNHYFASIPYRLEEECRLGTAILTFAEKRWACLGRPATVYTLGAGAGTLARALAKLGDGRLKTLNCSPTEGNRVCFFARRGSEDAQFYHGPFFELDDEHYEKDETLQPFRDGYDVLLEDTTFQMYGRDRDKQTGFIAPRLRSNGVLVQVQKLSHQNGDAYLERERQKDDLFKSRFFSGRQIAEKRRDVLDTMFDFQVDLETTRSALGSYFQYAVVTWNSGNFYTIVSSNSLSSLHEFVSLMVKPAIPSEFCYQQLPHIIVNQEVNPVHAGLAWRPPISIGGGA
ncbi:class I SAM-dependent methyltransferase [Oryzifoliimicrobium ureilyticus]|uniref:class I SAM-dependent methyltransferase n=1 Tax=Oryzifoliimicrobium ureilyticus TaxID=3113724 RepID=UPI0030764761